MLTVQRKIMKALKEIDLKLPQQSHFYRGKVREVYTIAEKYLVMIASDRISAFDVILPKAIPYKGQVLNQIANEFLDLTVSVVPNWKISNPDPVVTIGHRTEPFKVEMIIRGYLTGHAWRIYKAGTRKLCGVQLPEGLNENDPFPEPIITPTTKADRSIQDKDIDREEILAREIITEKDYLQLETYTKSLYNFGQQYAQKRNLILVDTKYEFGKTADGKIVLIDEVHTPDSSRYFYLDTYFKNQQKGFPQKQLSKEFVRQWLIKNGFQGKEGEKIPAMSDAFVKRISNRYIELYETITGESFNRGDPGDLKSRIETNIINSLSELNT